MKILLGLCLLGVAACSKCEKKDEAVAPNAVVSNAIDAAKPEPSKEPVKPKK